MVSYELAPYVLWGRKSISHWQISPMPLLHKLSCSATASQGCEDRDAEPAALPAPEVPCPVPLMTLLCSWAAAAADAAIVSLIIIQILDLLVTETFFFLSS